MAEIDWQAIGRLEGTSLAGYVPDPTGSQSGVTIACGVDIGQWSVASARNMQLPPALLARLLPYVGLRRDAAVVALADMPLAVSPAEAAIIDKADREPLIAALRAYYSRDTNGRVLADLPGSIQTALASVAYQYGPELRRKTPLFWYAAVWRGWQSMANELWHFGDAFPSRRRTEAGWIVAEGLAHEPG